MPAATSHGNMYGIGYMISGDRIIITPHKTVTVHPGTIQFMHRDLIHRTTYIADGIYENIDIKFRESVAERVSAIIGQEQFDMLYERISITLTPETTDRINQIVKLIEYEWNNYDTYSETVMESLVVQFFVTALRGQSLSPEMDPVLENTHFALPEAIQYIRCHYAEDPSLKETSKAAHISDAYLSRLFTSRLGTTYSRFLTEIKISHAMDLLMNTNLTITEVAAQCGYANSNYFSDAFKKVMGISPLKYRKRNRH
ncbi:MAG: AraC family transcriptional regulator [Bacteroides sp.]|nr:AraC family transcriptional regulator [Bacteroides sp.]